MDSLDELFDEIPSELQMRDWLEIPDGLNEMVLGGLMHSLAAKDVVGLNFIGAGAYQHHIPAVVWDVATTYSSTAPEK